MAIKFLNVKISEVANKIPDHAKFITTPEFNELTAKTFGSLGIFFHQRK